MNPDRKIHFVASHTDEAEAVAHRARFEKEQELPVLDLQGRLKFLLR